MPQYFYKICLVLLILSLSSLSIELSFITSIVVLIVSIPKRIDQNLLIITLFISTVAIIGTISTNWFKHSAFDLVKDVIYFVRPITILLSSYFIIKRIKSINFVFDAVVFIACLFAIQHIFVILINIGSIYSYSYLREIGGKHNHIELVALVFLFYTPFNTIFVKHRRLIKLILFISFVLYFSRTMYITLFIFYLGYKGYLLLNRRFLKGIMVFGLIVMIGGIIISNVETTRDSKGLRSFVYKTQNSFKELFVPFDSKKVKRDRRELWEHWRAYEAQKAIEQIGENGIKGWLIGVGYGEKVQLDTTVKLEGRQYSEVPTIHNGFVFVLFKTGIIGLLFYLLFIFSIFFKYQKFKVKKVLFNHLIVATSLYMLFNSFVITGFFRVGEFSMFFYGILLATKSKYELRGVQSTSSLK